MKGTELFTRAISEYIEREKAADELFAKCVNEQPKKTIEGCVNYILKTVKDSGINGWSDDEVFGMAKHFYDEKDLSDPGKIDARVVVNHHVELSEAEKEEAREKAKKEYLNAERKRLQDEDKKRKEREEKRLDAKKKADEERRERESKMQLDLFG